MLKQYKIILIDMYGVILEEGMGVVPYIYGCFDETEKERIDRIFREEGLIERLSVGEIGSDEFFAAFGFEDTKAKTKDYIENFLTLDKSFIDFAEKTKDKYELVLLSNDASDWSRYITEYYGIDKYFTHKIISAEMKCKKPQLEIFDKALEIIGRSAYECIFVDNSVKNLLAAEEVGIAPILFYRGGDRYFDMTVYNFEELGNLL